MTDESKRKSDGLENAAFWLAITGLGIFAVAVIFGFSSTEIAHLGMFEVLSRAATLVVSCAGLAAIFMLKRQISAQREQMIHEHNWRTHTSLHQLFSNVPSDAAKDSMYRLANAKGFADCLEGFGKPLNTEQLKILTDDPVNLDVTRSYLDGFEVFCGAIACRIVDPDYAYLLNSGRIIRNYAVFEPFIRYIQKDNSMAYVELQKLALNWNAYRVTADEQYRNSRGVGSLSRSKITIPTGNH